MQMIKLYTHRVIYQSRLCYCGLLSFGDVSCSDIFLSSNVMDGISLVELQKYQKGKKEKKKNSNNNKLTTWDAQRNVSLKKIKTKFR